MKSFVPHLVLGAAFACAACSTPEQRAAGHQRRLQAEDARKRAGEVADARRRAAEDAARYRAYEQEYARQLGKKPAQLTPAERAWVREHF